MTPEQRKHFEFVRDEMHGEPEQQKVVWDEKIGGVGFDSPLPNANYKVIATVTPKQNQEPIAWLCKKDNGHFDVLTDQTCKKCFPVYTTPQQRTWVGLTNGERLKLYRKFEDFLESDGWEYEKAIEAKLKDKNL
jgi:hypothetical protein